MSSLQSYRYFFNLAPFFILFFLQFLLLLFLILIFPPMYSNVLSPPGVSWLLRQTSFSLTPVQGGFKWLTRRRNLWNRTCETGEETRRTMFQWIHHTCFIYYIYFVSLNSNNMFHKVKKSLQSYTARWNCFSIYSLLVSVFTFMLFHWT